MRIIGGIHRSRTILGPPRGDQGTRPILDRVKQALFDRLWAMGVFPEPDAEGFITPAGNVLDIFSGTGSMGLEALSRGSEHCTFIDLNYQNREALEQNLATLELTDQATVLGVNALTPGWLGVLEHKPVRVAFCDPPYEMTNQPAGLTRVAALLAALATMPGIMEPNSLVILRTEFKADSPAIPGWEAPQVYRYGGMKLVFYGKV